MDIHIRQFQKSDICDVIAIWNQVVADGTAFPQMEFLNETEGLEFFGAQSYTGVAVNCENEKIVGVYILHPNNVGRCGHICNASYAVQAEVRGQRVGEHLVRHCMQTGRELGFKILQFNAVVAANYAALHLYKKLGFVQLGVIPDGFLMPDGTYQDIIPHYCML